MWVKIITNFKNKYLRVLLNSLKSSSAPSPLFHLAKTLRENGYKKDSKAAHGTGLEKKSEDRSVKTSLRSGSWQ